MNKVRLGTLILFVLTLHTSLSSAAACRLESMLTEKGKHKECEQNFLNAIADEHDRKHAAELLKKVKLPKDFEIQSGGDFIRAYQGESLMFRSLWLKKANPAILWIDGKILVDNSNSPSLARRLDNMFKSTKNKSAALDWSLLPKADAAAVSQDFAKHLTFLETLRFDAGTSSRSPASDTAAVFLGQNNVFAEHYQGNPEGLGCPMPNTENHFQAMPQSSGIRRVISFRYFAPGEFVLHFPQTKSLVGKQSEERWYKARLIPTSKSGAGQKGMSSGTELRVARCADESCKSTSAELGPASDSDSVAVRNEKTLWWELDSGLRQRLSDHAQSMDVAANCSNNESCCKEMKTKFSSNTQPGQSSGGTVTR